MIKQNNGFYDTRVASERNGVAEFAPSPQRGAMKKVYGAMLNGPKSKQEIALATGLTKPEVAKALSNGVYRGHFLKDPHRARWTIAPRSTFDAAHTKITAREAARRREDKETADREAQNIDAVLARLCKKTGRSRNEVMRLALNYYDRNCRRRVVYQDKSPRPWWKFWG